MDTTFGREFLKELMMEAPASRKCLERIPESFFNWKPHPKSMEMGYLALLVAEIPRWLITTIEEGEIDFATWERYKLTTSTALLEYFDENIEGAKTVLETISDEELAEMFYLKKDGEELMKATKKESVGSSLNHWVHHRGQLTVYMRLKDIAVPSIYGPSADEKSF